MRAFGKYRLLERIGSGGMAEVWRAEALGPEGFVKEVALKLIRGDHQALPDWVRMFVREAHLASRLTHANVVQVFDFGEVEGRHYIAMELVRGRTLREVVQRCREKGLRLGVERAVHICAEVARGLAYAHRYEERARPLGLVHRDVSPQNVLLSFEGEVKLTDFGIAHALGLAEATAPGTVKGKAAYMAPEQARSEGVDGRADVFAVGVILWELCAGRRLFARETDAATLSALLSPEPPSPPSAWNEAVPPELDALALAALERDPARRTGSAEELVAALAAIRLRMAAAKEDDLHLELRAFMRRLWTDAEVPAVAERPAEEGTGRRTLVREPGHPGGARGGEALAPKRPADEGGARSACVRGPGRPVGEDGTGGDSLGDAGTPFTVTLEAREPKLIARSAAGGGRLGLRRPVARRLVLVACGVGACALAFLGVKAVQMKAVQKAAERTEAHGRAAPLREQAAAAVDGGPTPSLLATAARVQPPPAVSAARVEPPPAVSAARVEPPPASSAPRRSAGERAPPEARVLEMTNVVGSLRTPRAETGQGVLAVTAEPFGAVFVDGKPCGETPLELRLAAGVHRVRVAHEELGKREASIRVQPGKRSTWTVDLARTPRSTER